MLVANFRFYEELNDFLPPRRRKCAIACVCASGATVKHAIEALGVPHTEVELILANSESVDFSYVLQEGDHISVYPVLESLDVTRMVKVRAEPLRRTRFIADAQLGGLAKYLRMLGFDTLYENRYTDAQVARISANEQRIVLTRDRALLMHKLISHGCYVRGTRPIQQLEEIVSRLDLYRAIKPLSRCLRCNRELEPVAKEVIRDRLPPGGAPFYRRFWICHQCDRIYWEGSHWHRMEQVIGDLMRRSNSESGPHGSRQSFRTSHAVDAATPSAKWQLDNRVSHRSRRGPGAWSWDISVGNAV